MSLNSSGEGSYNATLVATGGFDSDLLAEDRKNCLANLAAGRPVESLRPALVEAYRDLCSSMPDAFKASFQPAVSDAVWGAGGFLLQVSTLLHAGPGNKTSRSPRVSGFSAVGTRGRQYDGQTQVLAACDREAPRAVQVSVDRPRCRIFTLRQGARCAALLRPGVRGGSSTQLGFS